MVWDKTLMIKMGNKAQQKVKLFNNIHPYNNQ